MIYRMETYTMNMKNAKLGKKVYNRYERSEQGATE